MRSMRKINKKRQESKTALLKIGLNTGYGPSGMAGIFRKIL